MIDKICCKFRDYFCQELQDTFRPSTTKYGDRTLQFRCQQTAPYTSKSKTVGVLLDRANPRLYGAAHHKGHKEQAQMKQINYMAQMYESKRIFKAKSNHYAEHVYLS